jgi:hypothetical protein
MPGQYPSHLRSVKRQDDHVFFTPRTAMKAGQTGTHLSAVGTIDDWPAVDDEGGPISAPSRTCNARYRCRDRVARVGQRLAVSPSRHLRNGRAVPSAGLVSAADHPVSNIADAQDSGSPEGECHRADQRLRSTAHHHGAVSYTMIAKATRLAAIAVGRACGV